MRGRCPAPTPLNYRTDVGMGDPLGRVQTGGSVVEYDIYDWLLSVRVYGPL